MKENIFQITKIAVFGIFVIVGALIVSGTGFTIRNLGTSIEQDGKIINTISVSGDGKVYVKPDMAILNISVSELSPTSEEAINKASEKINEVTKVSKTLGVVDEDIKTTQYSVYTEYDYSRDQRRVLGQRATIGVEIRIKKLDDKATKATRIIDGVSKISNIEISSIQFDLENKEDLFSRAREIAFNKAKRKAEELSSLANVKLITPVQISDASYDTSLPPMMRNVAFNDLALESKSGTSGSISTGQLEINANISVIWGIE